MLSVQPLRKRKSNNVTPIPKHPANVIPFPSQARRATDFDRLTAELVMKQYRDGTLNPVVLEALLLGVGLEP